MSFTKIKEIAVKLKVKSALKVVVKLKQNILLRERTFIELLGQRFTAFHSKT